MLCFYRKLVFVQNGRANSWSTLLEQEAAMQLHNEAIIHGEIVRIDAMFS